MEQSSDDLSNLFGNSLYPSSARRRQRHIDKRGLLVHYTTANSVKNILSSPPSLWMRPASVMNDWSEINYGFKQLNKALASKIGKNFLKTLDEVWTGSADKALNDLNRQQLTLADETYILSISEHLQGERNHGRLSMWRAYGGQCGVAIVLNTTVFQQEKSRFDLLAHPAIYRGDSEIRSDLKITNQHFKKHINDLRRKYTYNYWVELIKRFFLNYVICLKHPAFKEEREWRVIYHKAFQQEGSKPEPTVQVIGDIPQHIIAIPLHDDEKEGFRGYHPDLLINKLLVGPTDYPVQVYTSLVQILRDAGVNDPEDRVHVTDIPLRPNQR